LFHCARNTGPVDGGFAVVLGGALLSVFAGDGGGAQAVAVNQLAGDVYLAIGFHGDFLIASRFVRVGSSVTGGGGGGCVSLAGQARR
jgi:hypothetical protein